MTEVPGCDGRCCAAFYFPSSPREILDKIDEHGEYNGNDGMMIANMLIPLTEAETVERVEKWGLNPNIVKIDGDHMFRCKHFDEETRQCTVYDARPDMCATYPYGREEGCGHCGAKGGCTNGSGWRDSAKRRN